MNAGDPQFVFLGNNRSVDFVNTEIVIRGKLTDLLQNCGDLMQWATDAGFRLSDELSTDSLASVKALRVALKDVFHAQIDQSRPKPSALRVINSYLAKYTSHKELRVKNGGYVMVPDKNAFGIGALLANLAYEGSILLTSGQRTRLKRCSNADCVLLFLDLSRSKKRRWCSMETCGNRAKVAKYYRSHIPQ